jgi:hypothetical protein
LVNQLLKAPTGIDFNTFIDRLVSNGPAFLFLRVMISGLILQANVLAYLILL